MTTCTPRSPALVFASSVAAALGVAVAMAVAALVLLATWSPAAQAQTCPSNRFSAGSTGGYFEDSSTEPSHGWFGSSYNLVAGTIKVGTTGSGEAGSFEALTIQDLYTLVGPVSATPIALVARVRFTGTVGADVVNLPPNGPNCVGSSAHLSLASASLTDDTQVVSDPSAACAARTFDETLNLAISKLPGEQFPLSVTASLSAGHTIPVQASGLITFVGLPPGYSVQSCQGYALAPVATRVTSWGRVKQLYR